MNRRTFLARAAASAAALPAASLAYGQSRPAVAATRQTTKLADDLVWHDVRDWGVEGRAFSDVENNYDRLPKRAKGVVRHGVWYLSHHTAGMSTRFDADAPLIAVRYELTGGELAMSHMPASGVSGVDLYARDGSSWRFVATHQPKAQQVEARLGETLAPGRRTYLLHLPLYNGVKSLAIGVPKDAAATFAPVSPRKDKPVVFYGTSITQGGCASRPGMAFTNILARRLDRPVLNFGFSGNGKMEVEVGRFLAEIDAAALVIDCSANLTAADITQRCGPLVKLFRERHAEMPILLLDERPRPEAWVMPELARQHAEKSAALKRAHEQIAAAGDTRVFFRGDEGLIGSDGEATVDGSHPTDLGMMRYGDALEPELRKLLGGRAS